MFIGLLNPAEIWMQKSAETVYFLLLDDSHVY